MVATMLEIFYKQAAVKEHNTIDLTQQASELYFALVKDEKGIIAAEKIIKQ